MDIKIEFWALDTRDGKIYRPNEFGIAEINNERYCINFNGDVCFADDDCDKVDNIKLMMVMVKK